VIGARVTVAQQGEDDPDKTRQFLNAFFGKQRYSANPTDHTVYEPVVHVRVGDDLPEPHKVVFNPDTDIEGEVE